MVQIQKLAVYKFKNFNGKFWNLYHCLDEKLQDGAGKVFGNFLGRAKVRNVISGIEKKKRKFDAVYLPVLVSNNNKKFIRSEIKIHHPKLPYKQAENAFVPKPTSPCFLRRNQL
jgi:hypothetical protein